MTDHVTTSGGVGDCGGGGGWRSQSVAVDCTDLQTSLSMDLTDDQDTPRYQPQPGWEHRVLLRQIVIVLLLDCWIIITGQTYLHLTVNIGSDGIEMTINVKIF